MEGNYKRKFIQISKSWYAKTALRDSEEDFTIGVYHDEGGTIGEFNVKWHALNNKLSPKLHAWDDSWMVLSTYFQDLLRTMGEIDSDDIAPDEFAKKLEELGIENATDPVGPYEEPDAAGYVLTMKVNDYDQYGEYYVKGWPFKPSEAAIEEAIKRETAKEFSRIPPDYDIDFQTIIEEEGRRGNEDVWFYLRRIEGGDCA